MSYIPRQENPLFREGRDYKAWVEFLKTICKAAEIAEGSLEYALINYGIRNWQNIYMCTEVSNLVMIREWQVIFTQRNSICCLE